ncbi:MAG: ABC transporter ATP-binding protein [Myxococcota bacterium]
MKRQGFLRLLALARHQVGRMVVGTACLLLASGATLAAPRLVQSLFDQGLEQADLSVLNRTAGVLLVLFVVQAVAGSFRYYLFTTAGERIVTELRQKLLTRFLEQETSFFDRHRTGELLSRLSSDTQLIQNAVSVNVSMALRSIVGAVGATVLLFTISVRLALLMLLVLPLIGLGALVYGRVVRRRSHEAQEALARASEVAEEALSSIRTVRSFNAEPREAARYRARVEAAYAASERRIAATSSFFGGATLSAYSCVLGVFLYGGHLSVRGVITGGELASFVLYTLILAVSLGTLADLWSDLMRATGATRRVFVFLDRETTIEPSTLRAEPVDSVRARGALELEQVGFAYPTRPDVVVLDNVSLRIEPGKTVALVGPSGGGKSTIVKLLLRLYDPTSGVIRLDGRPIQEMDVRWLRKQMALVAQEPVLFSASIAENIRYGRPDASDAAVAQAAQAAHAIDFIRKLPDGFQSAVGERGIQLSGGQRQRVAIARAILKDPPVLILDEATSALDAEAESEVKKALDRLREGRTTLVVAHRLSTVKDADEVVVMNGGSVQERGSHEALMRRDDGLYRRLVSHQLLSA